MRTIQDAFDIREADLASAAYLGPKSILWLGLLIVDGLFIFTKPEIDLGAIFVCVVVLYKVYSFLQPADAPLIVVVGLLIETRWLHPWQDLTDLILRDSLFEQPIESLNVLVLLLFLLNQR